MLPNISANRGTEPNKLTGLLRNELDWIVMKALEKDRARRYESANGFAADVQRHLAGEAVQAHPPSAGYRMRKFIRRHKGRVLAASLLLAALVAGLASTTWQAIRATHAEGAARDEQKKTADALTVADEQGKRADNADRQYPPCTSISNTAISDVPSDCCAWPSPADDPRTRQGTSGMYGPEHPGVGAEVVPGDDGPAKIRRKGSNTKPGRSHGFDFG